ncbi:phosphate ABC transporter permease subunit PstC [Natronorubrum daqingense]|uniref:Phosphate transport system permease protein n=1 Tax=Natronorubrum daqingense TaxID=588898 RepID=A0A1N7AGT5_9EURY|nr:phosphate ABC transporter permease subunit PstC [Natronorubrum daqingense]APX97987.1 phosphate ABC transporter permease subunit PstC [Natronorubrum daqingense]SIR38278.1 phosphate ABC transporter membrane protein 1, PhoT family [Natronorubrum daqingense]
MSTETDPGPGISGDGADADQRRDRRIRRLLFGCTSITVLTTVAIFAVLFDNTFNFFYDVRFHEWIVGLVTEFRLVPEQRVAITEFLTDTAWRPSHADDPRFGILPLIAGTLLVTVGAAFISIPIGTATALYLAEYARPRTRKYLKPTLEVLAGVPTIVYGFFALTFITPNVVGPLGSLLGHDVGRFSALSGAIVVGVMTIPMVASISEDAMSSVPDNLRNGAYALGASKYSVSTSVVLPASISGMMASYILAVSRAIGETMAVVLAAGVSPNLTANPFAEIQTMTAYMVDSTRSTMLVGSIEYQSLYAVGLALFVMTLAANLVNDYIKRSYREVYR